jgi:hypothetical protein
MSKTIKHMQYKAQVTVIGEIDENEEEETDIYIEVASTSWLSIMRSRQRSGVQIPTCTGRERTARDGMEYVPQGRQHGLC